MKNTHYLFLLLSLFSINIFSQNNPCVDAEAYHIVVLGSSTAAGAGASHPDSAWVNRYRTFLKNINPENEVTNLAVGGFTTYRIMPTGFIPPATRPSPDTTKNITTAVAMQPDGIVVNLPSNDVSSGFSVAEQLANFDTIVQHAAYAGIPIWVCTTQPKNYGGNPIPIQKQIDVRDSILAKYSPFTLDFWTELADSTDQIDAAFDSGDGTHLNDMGHALLFNRVKEKGLPELLFQANMDFPDYTFAEFKLVETPACGDQAIHLLMVFYNKGLPGNDVFKVEVNAAETTGTYVVGFQEDYDDPLGTCEFDTLDILLSVNQKGFYEIGVKITASDDGNPDNDIFYIYSDVPGIPSIEIFPETDCTHNPFLLQALAHPTDSIRWWDAPMGGNIVGGGSIFETPPLSASTTYYAEAVRGLFFYKNEITAAENFNIKWNGTMFDLVANEELVIDSLAMVIADTGNQAVEIYTRNGSHLGHETDFFAWDYHGAFPVQLVDSNALTTLKVSPLTIPANDTTAIYLQLSNPNSRLGYLSNGVTDTIKTDELTLFAGSGSSHNFGGNFYPRIWAGKLFYHFGEKPNGDCTTERMPVEAIVQEIEVDLGSDTILNLNETIQLDAGNGFTTYQWSDGSSGQTLELDGELLGTGIYTYSVVATDSIGCTASDTIIVVFAPLLNADEKNGEIGFHYFPNPTDDELIIELKKGNWQIGITAPNGSAVRSYFFDCIRSCHNTLDVSDLSAGIYFLKTIKNNSTATFSRLVVF